MNQTLEEIAKAIFKSWFVDFDPVRAKAEGRPTGLPPEISDLFPDELVDSEIGEIPERVGNCQCYRKSLTSKVAVNHSKDVIDDQKADGYVRCSRKRLRITSEHITCSCQEEIRLVDEDDLRLVDYCWQWEILRKVSPLRPSGANQCCGSMFDSEFIVQNSREFIASMFSSGLFYKWISLVARIERCRRNFKKVPFGLYVSIICCSPRFCQSTKSMISPHMGENQKFQKHETLAELRDTLLPKLISGELRIPDAEKFLEEAGI